MHQRDLARWNDGAVLEADVCIVGTGPAGTSIVAELARARVRVCVLEGGGTERESATQALYAFESVGHPWGVGDLVRRERVLGGTSTTWTGRCAPFDPIDFRPRSWVPHSGWPIARSELEPYLERAGTLLGLGPQRYDDSLWERFGVDAPRPPLDPALLRQQIWQYSRGPDNAFEPVRFAEDVLSTVGDATNVTLVTHANVTRIETTEGGAAVAGVEARSLNGNRLVVRAPIVVLACGAIENARLLLASRDEGRPNGLGNEHDLVGRYLMDHPAPVVATFDPSAAGVLLHRFGHYWLDDARGRHVYLLGVGLSERAQMSRGLLNCTASLLSEPYADAAMIALRRLARAGGGISEARAIVRDLFHVARAPGEIASALARRARHRPEITPVSSLTLICHVEQLPDPGSRVMLSDKRDALGVPIVRVDWRVHELERDTVLATFESLRRELLRLGLPPPWPTAWVRGEGDWRAAFHDMAHPTGTTRMHDDPRSGVVDARLRVHGIEGLYVAGSSVFTTAGTANPTLMICALSVRLADHLRAIAGRSRPVEIVSPHAAVTSTPDRVRVGIVGAGKRVESIYLPVLSALAPSLELVGITSRSADRREHVAARAGTRAYRSAEELVERARPDFVVVCVSPEANATVAATMIDAGVRALLETPLAFSVREGRALLARIEQRGIAVGVAEQMPFLPLEELKALLRDAGVFGRVLAAHNDLHTFDYHGIAQLRRYLGADRKPVEASATFGAVPLATGQRAFERWTTGSVRYDDGAMLHQQLGAGVSPILSRIPGSLRIHGEHASMIGSEVRAGGATARVERHEHKDTRTLEALSIALPDIGRITWENALRELPLNDEQIAVAMHLVAMRRAALGHGEPLYSAKDALRDVEILRAMELSAHMNGAPVALPLRIGLEAVRMAARPSYWIDRMRA